jgi:CRP/FNR family cyclic AMP-dependent transcriptional regulator
MSRANSSIDDGHELLMGCSLFRLLDEDVRHEFASRAHRSRFSAGQTIFHMGSEGQSMMAVLTGTVRISMPSPQGKQIVLADLRAGEIFGEIALLDGRGRSAEATALTNCDLVVLSRRDVLPVIQQYPDVCLTLLEVVCRRLREADERMADIVFFDAPVRLAKILLRGAGERGERDGGDSCIKIALSQQELGNMAGVRRERVNQCLRDWQRRGMIGLKNGWIIIHKRSMLEALVHRG